MKNGSRWVMGIAASHNGAVCLLKDGEVEIAIQEERLSGIKRDNLRPAHAAFAIEYALQHARLQPLQLDSIVYCTQTSSHRPENDLSRHPLLGVCNGRVPIIRISHHLGHAISGIARAGVDDAAVLVVDGLGSPHTDLTKDEVDAVFSGSPGSESISMYWYRDGILKPLAKQLAINGQWLPGLFEKNHTGMSRFGSIGGLYSAVAMQIFGDPMAAGKVMGLAPYGKPAFESALFGAWQEGHFKPSARICESFPHDVRFPAARRVYEDLAASAQSALEECLLELVKRLYALAPSPNLVMSGGVALNCVANEHIRRHGPFASLYVDPAAEDSGTALGAAFYAELPRKKFGSSRIWVSDSMGHSYTESDILNAHAEVPDIQEVYPQCPIDEVARMLSEGHTVGWFLGGAEFGPRALGHRSILADPRTVGIKSYINSRIKLREDFRPFAPAILIEEYNNWFDTDSVDSGNSFMLRAVPVRDECRSLIPEVVHVNGTSRVQVVSATSNPIFYELLSSFRDQSGIPVLLNTSMNMAGEPIAETPLDALWLLFFSELSYCYIDGHLYRRAAKFSHPLDYIVAQGVYKVDAMSEGHDTIICSWRSGGRSLKTELPHAYKHIINSIDREQSGWEIHRSLGEQSSSLTVQALSYLRRIGLITLRKSSSAN